MNRGTFSDEHFSKRNRIFCRCGITTLSDEIAHLMYIIWARTQKKTYGGGGGPEEIFANVVDGIKIIR